jgi:hypothetical protein
MDEELDISKFEEDRCLKQFKDAKTNKYLVYSKIQTSKG